MASAQSRLGHYTRFLGGAVLCAALNNAVLIAGDWFGYSYTALIFIAYLISVSVGYAYHCRITFEEAMTFRGYASFSANIWLGLPLSLAILAVLKDLLGLPIWLAGPIMTGLMVIYHYLVARITIGRQPLLRDERGSV